MTERQPFWPICLLGKEALEALYPYFKQAVANDMDGGRTREELADLVNQTRAYLQHDGVFLD